MRDYPTITPRGKEGKQVLQVFRVIMFQGRITSIPKGPKPDDDEDVGKL